MVYGIFYLVSYRVWLGMVLNDFLIVVRVLQLSLRSEGDLG